LAAITLNNASIAWYATPIGGIPLATGSTYSPTISQNTTFYAQANGGFGNLVTARTPVKAYTSGRTLPLVEGFQGNGLPSGWTIKNSNNSALTWSQTNVGNGAEAAPRSFTYQNYFGGTDFVNGQVIEQDELRTPALDFSNTPFPKLTFDLAYAYNNANDGLGVWVSTDCGQTFMASAFNKKGQALSTAGTQTSPFTPNSAGQWATQTVDLSDYAGNANVIVAFRNTPAYGNNLYVDNVRVENAPYFPTASFINPTSICLNQPTLFTNTSTGGATNGYLWTFLDHNSQTLGTSTQKSPSWTFTTPEWVSARLTVTNSQGTTTYTGPWILINQSSTVTSTTPGSRTGTGTVTLAAQASNYGTLSWYAVTTGGTALGTGTSFTTPSLSATTTYYVEASNGACPSSRVAVQATINGSTPADVTPPTAPTGLTASGTSLTSTTLAWTAATDDAGVVGYDLYQGGNLVASVSGTTLAYTVSGLSSGTTYSFLVKAKDAAGNVSAASNTVSVTTLSNAVTAPIASFTVSTPICIGQSITFTNTSTGGSTTTYQWTFFDHNNNPLGTSLATHPTWTFTNEEWVSARLIATNALGTSTSYGPNWLYANPQSTVTSTTPGSRTGTGTISLAAQCSNSGTLSWYGSLTGGTVLGTGTNFTTPTISTTTTYYVEASKAGFASPRVPVVATINGDNTNVTAPVASFTVSSPIGLGQPVLFTNTSTGGPSTTYQWTFLDHNSSPLGTSLATNPTWTFTNEEWVEARLIATNAQGTSTSYGPNWIYANTVPAVISATPASRTGTGPVTLSAQSSFSGTLSWFATLTGGTALGTGTNFTTPAISTTTTYYVEASKAGCTSARVPVVATVN
jgi:PKD repeat protein